MKSFLEVVEEVLKRGDSISPQLPRANWIGLQGNFTPQELRSIADEVEKSFKKKINGNTH